MSFFSIFNFKPIFFAFRFKSKPLYYFHCLPKICIHRRFHFQLQGYHYFCTIVYCSFFISKRTFSASILVCRNCNLEGQMPHQSQAGSQYIHWVLHWNRGWHLGISIAHWQSCHFFHYVWNISEFCQITGAL